jgi:5'-deoxy-5'-methylthioadenosine phosphorylase
MYAILAGSGATYLADLGMGQRKTVTTPYGAPSGPLTFSQIGGHDVVYLARHGEGHSIPPHLVNYRANIWALRAQNVAGIIAIAAVGGIANDLGPGTLAVPDQILDYTWGREHTFFSGGEAGVTHIDFTHPYTERLRQRILVAAEQAGEIVRADGVYATTQGPRLESAAEVDRLERDGADMIGMTGMPEAALARELGLDYATIALSVNFAAGRGDSALGIDVENIGVVLQNAMHRVHSILERVVEKE